MSTTEAAPDTTTTEQNGHVASTPGMGGTSTAEDARADDTEPTAEGEGAEAEGAEPEAAAEQRGADYANREDVGKDKAYVETLESKVADADAISRTILADPARLREYQKWVRADNGGGANDDPLAGIDRDIEESFPRQEDRDAVRKFVGPLVQRVRDLDEKYRTLAPRVEQSARIATTTAVASSAETHGVPAETLRTKEWRKFVADETRRDKDLAQDMSRKPARAGKLLAQAWLLRSGTKAQRSAENRRTSDLKNGVLHNGASPSRNGATKVTVIDKSKPGWDLELLNARLAAAERGEKFQHTFATPKK